MICIGIKKAQSQARRAPGLEVYNTAADVARRRMTSGTAAQGGEMFMVLKQILKEQNNKNPRHWASSSSWKKCYRASVLLSIYYSVITFFRNRLL